MKKILLLLGIQAISFSLLASDHLTYGLGYKLGYFLGRGAFLLLIAVILFVVYKIVFKKRATHQK